MNDFELGKLLSKGLELAEKAAEGKTFILKPETILKLERILKPLKCDYALSFDRVSNAVDIRLKEFMFDSIVDGTKALMTEADFYVIDAEIDGRVCIELRLLNAADVIEK